MTRACVVLGAFSASLGPQIFHFMFIFYKAPYHTTGFVPSLLMNTSLVHKVNLSQDPAIIKRSSIDVNRRAVGSRFHEFNHDRHGVIPGEIKKLIRWSRTGLQKKLVQ